MDTTETYDIIILWAENERLKKRIRELEYVHQLDMAEIINYRRQIELLIGEKDVNIHV